LSVFRIIQSFSIIIRICAGFEVSVAHTILNTTTILEKNKTFDLQERSYLCRNNGQTQPHFIIILDDSQAWTFNFGCDRNITYEVCLNSCLLCAQKIRFIFSLFKEDMI
jgi:hypothetical protein